MGVVRLSAFWSSGDWVRGLAYVGLWVLGLHIEFGVCAIKAFLRALGWAFGFGSRLPGSFCSF